jgi:hypothetical protein
MPIRDFSNSSSGAADLGHQVGQDLSEHLLAFCLTKVFFRIPATKLKSILRLYRLCTCSRHENINKARIRAALNIREGYEHNN